MTSLKILWHLKHIGCIDLTFNNSSPSNFIFCILPNNINVSHPQSQTRSVNSERDFLSPFFLTICSMVLPPSIKH